MYSINIIVYSNREPFNSTKKLLIETITNFTDKNVIIHDYDENRIKNSEWYDEIKNLPNVTGVTGGKNGWSGRRDGYYNCWKPFIVNEVYKNINKGDILYYVDSSQYYKTGFTENINKLCDIVLKYGIIAGSVGKDITNNKYGCCDNLNVWNKILYNRNNSKILNNMHILNSWFILVKNNINTYFLRDWTYWSVYKDDELKNPLVTYHHTADQSIFNILVYRYNFRVFYHPKIGHNENKDRNIVLNIINNDVNAEKYFILLENYTRKKNIK